MIGLAAMLRAAAGWAVVGWVVMAREVEGSAEDGLAVRAREEVGSDVVGWVAMAREDEDWGAGATVLEGLGVVGWVAMAREEVTGLAVAVARAAGGLAAAARGVTETAAVA